MSKTLIILIAIYKQQTINSNVFYLRIGFRGPLRVRAFVFVR